MYAIVISKDCTDPGNGKASSDESATHANPDLNTSNVTDGGEFLDDLLRMKEQPFGHTGSAGENGHFADYE